MTRCWTVSCLFLVLLASPNVAVAQETDTTADVGQPSLAIKADASETDSGTEQTSDRRQATAAPEAARDEGQNQPPPAAGSSTTEEKPERDKTAVLGAAAPTPPQNPYQLFLTVGLLVGAGTFVPDADRDLVGYNLSFLGLYKVSDVLDGRIDVFGLVRADQSLTVNSQGDDGSVGQREFFFRDIRIGLLGRAILQDDYTGLIFGGGTSFDLPTGTQAQAQGRFVRWNVSANMSRIFSDVGPGSLFLRLATTARFDFGDATLVNDTNSALCNSISADEAGNCYSGQTGTTFGLLPSLSVTYLFGDFNVGIGITFINVWSASASDSVVVENPNQVGGTVSQSPFATTDGPYTLLTSTDISFTYNPNENLVFTIGVATVTSPIDTCNTDRDDLSPAGDCVVFPFYDFTAPTNNATSFYFNSTLMY